ncbi:MAG: transglutaminase domain-containing protein, partial [Coprococcus sp.]
MRKDMRRRLCVGVVAFFTAIAVMGGVRYSAFASDYHANEDSFEDEALVEETVDLSDTLQKGGLGISQPSGDVATLASTYDKDAFDARLVEAFKNYESSVDVSDIGITRDEAYNGGINTVINSHPEIIGIAGTSYYYSPSTNLVTKIVITYTSNAREEQQKLDAAINELNSRVDISGMTDEEIVLAYHEYLTSTVAYAYAAYLQGSLGGAHEYDMYGALVNHSSVCQGYAETMFYLLKKAGLSCAIASSQNINHAWNIVKVNGKWYHVDATWDDPVWDMPGRSNHDYFLVSFDTMNKNTLVNHTKDRTDMVVSAQWGDTYTSAIDTTYESGKFWNGVNKAILYKDGYWYSIGSGASDTGYQINKYQYSTGINKVIYSGTAKWTAPSGGYYPGVYGSIYLHGNSLYFATPDSLKKIDLISAAASPVEILNIRTKYNSASGSNLYAFGEQYGKVVYFIADTPNLKQTKDTSDSTKYNKNYEEYTLDICISHNWDAGVIVTAPTYKNEGTKKYTCTNCGETKTETIAKLVC